MDYKFSELSHHEKEFHEMMLLQELDYQGWYGVAYSQYFEKELVISLQ